MRHLICSMLGKMIRDRIRIRDLWLFVTLSLATALNERALKSIRLEFIQLYVVPNELVRP